VIVDVFADVSEVHAASIFWLEVPRYISYGESTIAADF
jgi:hypothetical protein